MIWVAVGGRGTLTGAVIGAVLVNYAKTTFTSGPLAPYWLFMLGGLFVAVTGVSGSGKSTLIEDILHRAMARSFYRARVIPGAHNGITGFEHLDKVIDINQSPMGRTPRSNPQT